MKENLLIRHNYAESLPFPGYCFDENNVFEGEKS